MPAKQLGLTLAAAAALASAACDSAEPSTDAGTDAAVDAATPPTDGGDRTPPEILDLALTETPVNVLAYVLEVETDEPATLAVEVDGPGGAFTLERGEPATTASLWIGGLRPESGYDVTVTATDASGNAASDTARIDTSALPDGFPPIHVRTADAASMAPGYTLFNVFRWGAGENRPDSERSWLVALDASGSVVWYHEHAGRAQDVRMLEDGHLLFNYGDVGMIELDREGAVRRHFVATGTGEEVPEGATGVALDSIHHESALLPNGNYLVLSTERRTVTAAQCPSYGEDLEVVGDVIAEVDRDSGEVVASVSTFDDLDPCRRLDRGFQSGFWNAHYGGVTTQDWTHGNAAHYDAEAGLVYVSLRHSDWIVAYRWEPGGGGATGEVAWVLGDEGAPGDYGALNAPAPTGTPFEWFYHQHAPHRTAAGTLLVFDNGNLRPGTNFDPDDALGDADLPYSRAVEYAVDTSAADPAEWTVEQVWEWIPTDPATRYAPFLGDADELSNGNVLMTFGGILDPASDAIRNPAHKKRARLIEVTRDASEAVVFDVEVLDEADADFEGYSVYRAERIAERFLRPEAP